MSDYQKILALDFGTKRIGVAISAGILAEPLEIIPHSPEMYQKILSLLTEHQIEKIIVGISENEMAELTKKFVEKLQAVTSVPIVFVDETLSSWEVQQRLFEAGQSRLREKGNIDHFAAAVILQKYLDGE